EYTFLFSEQKNDSTLTTYKISTGQDFGAAYYFYLSKGLRVTNLRGVFNTVDEAFYIFPHQAEHTDGGLTFLYEHPLATITAHWQIDPEYASDVKVTQTLIAKKDGYYSLASPTLARIPEENVAWVTVPGYFQSNVPETDFVSAYAYGHDIPSKPVIYRERTISTLVSIADTKDSISLAVIP